MKIYDYNEFEYGLKVLPEYSFSIKSISNELTNINISSISLLNKIKNNLSDIYSKIDLYNNIEKMFGYMFLLEIMNQFPNNDQFNPYEIKELIFKIKDKFQSTKSTKYKKWNITDKTFIGLMVEHKIKPKYYKNIFNVSKDSLAHQIKKFK